VKERHALSRLACGLAAALTATLVPLGAGLTGTAAASPCGNVGNNSSFGSLDLSFLGQHGSPMGPQKAAPAFDNGTSKVMSWVTGPRSLNKTYTRFGISGTDLGVAWDNGRGQTLLAFGDTFGNCRAGGQWRSNTVLRSSDRNPADGLRLDGSGFAGEKIGALRFHGLEQTIVPTSGISIGGKQYMNVMSVRYWGAPGHWDTNYSGIAVSGDNGRSWRTVPSTFRVNAGVTVPIGENQPTVVANNSRFQQNAYVRGVGADAGWIFQYGTPSGRQGATYLSRFRPGDILNLDKYEYWTGRGWTRDLNAMPNAPVVRPPGSEMSVAYSPYLRKYVMLHTIRGVVLRTASRPQGPWSRPRSIVPAGTAEIYGPMMLPNSPALTGAGPELYYNGSRWKDYNVLLMRTRLKPHW